MEGEIDTPTASDGISGSVGQWRVASGGPC